jgi:hypothetical protein
MYEVERMHSQFATLHPGVLAASCWLKRPEVPPFAWVIACHD